MPAMIYHAPYPLNRQATSASGIRPVQMRDAFEANGYDVWEVTGTPQERRQLIKKIRQAIENGQSFDFLYSESATIPTMLAGQKHFPPHPFLDVALFKHCARNAIPTSLFYRDIYWAFDSYLDLVKPGIAHAMRQLYRYDLRWYAKYVDLLYLPSEKMADYVPVYPQSRTKALPPGAQIKDPEHSDTGTINMLYIGGVGEHYKLHEAVRAVASTPGASMTICTRENEWEKVKEQYEPLMDDSIRVVHRSGDGLAELYAQADVCSLFVDPGEYRSFAAPVKLYEYVGYGLPVISSAGTHAADFVQDNHCGWSVDYSAEALSDLLARLSSAPQELATMTSSVKVARQNHTWLARAAQVADDMAESKVRSR